MESNPNQTSVPFFNDPNVLNVLSVGLLLAVAIFVAVIWYFCPVVDTLQRMCRDNGEEKKKAQGNLLDDCRFGETSV